MDSDVLLVRLAISGDERAMRVLWARHAPRVDAVVRRLVGPDPDRAADVAQEVWIQIFRALPSWRGDSQFGTWVHRVAVNRTLNALRGVRRQERLETSLDAAAASGRDGDGADASLARALEAATAVEPEGERALVAQAIEAAAARLAPGARQVFVLHDVEGWTHEEIAERLGITAGGSKSQLFKARARLRQLLAPLVEGRASSGPRPVRPAPGRPSGGSPAGGAARPMTGHPGAERAPPDGAPRVAADRPAALGPYHGMPQAAHSSGPHPIPPHDATTEPPRDSYSAPPHAAAALRASRS